MVASTENSPTGPVVEVEFSIQDPTYPFIGASESEGCTFDLAEMIPREDGRYAEFFNISDVSPERITDLADDHESLEASYLREYDNGGLVEFLVAEDCPAVTLAEHGALPREVEGRDGEGRIVAEIPPPYDPPTVIAAFLDESSTAELVSKRLKDSFTPLFSASSLTQVLHSHLTARQREVLRAAYEAGYYEWPSECTGEEVAEELGITSATFSEHITAAERNLLTALFEGPD